MTRWGLVGVIVLAAACGGKKDDDKPAGESSGTGPSAKPADKPPKVKLGADDAACTAVLEKIERIYEVENPDMAYAMLSEMKGGEAYDGLWRMCTKWSSEQERACVTAAADSAALERCAFGDARAIDANRGVEACKGGLVDELSCPGDWPNGKVCVPAPAGYTVEGSGNELALVYPDSTRITLGWQDDDKECGRLGSIPLLSDYPIHAECSWPDGKFVAYTRPPHGEDKPGDERQGRASLCAESSQAWCRVKGAPALEAACAGLQYVAKPAAPGPRSRDEKKSAAAGDTKAAASSADDAVARVCECKDLACHDQRRAELTKAQSEDPRVAECRRRLASP